MRDVGVSSGPKGSRRAAVAVLGWILAPVPTLAAPELQERTDPVEAREDSLRCLTLAIAYEAGNQAREGQEAVAEVVLNRTHHPAFPRSVCGVVFQGVERGSGCQFTFACDGALGHRLADRTVRGARAVAEQVMAGTAPRHVAGALNYHATYVHPAWAPTLDAVARIGAHVFYRPQAGGQPVGGNDGEGRTVSRHGLITRLYARYETAPPDPAQVLPAPVVAVESPKVFAPWGLSVR